MILIFSRWAQINLVCNHLSSSIMLHCVILTSFFDVSTKPIIVVINFITISNPRLNLVCKLITIPFWNIALPKFTIVAWLKIIHNFIGFNIIVHFDFFNNWCFIFWLFMVFIKYHFLDKFFVVFVWLVKRSILVYLSFMIVTFIFV